MTFPRAYALLGLAMLLVPGCATDPQSPTEQTEAAQTAVHPARRFTVTAPLTEPRLESLRRELESSDVGYAWVATEGATFAVRVEPWGGVDATDLPSLVEDAYAFHRRLGDPSASAHPIRALAALPKTPEGLGSGLDKIGRAPIDGTGDDPATSERAALAHLLDVATSGPRASHTAVLAGELHEEPDMDWEGVFVVVDLEHGELLFATGGRGN